MRYIFNDGFKIIEGNYVGKENDGFKSVRLPHDYAMDKANELKEEFGKQNGFINTHYDVTYRKIFDFTPEEDRAYKIGFDGVFRNSFVYINGVLIGNNKTGYFPFSYDITPVLINGENILEIYVDNTNPLGDRWYTGMGIYRDVYFYDNYKSHILENEVCVKTKIGSCANITISGKISTACGNNDTLCVQLFENKKEAYKNSIALKENSDDFCETFKLDKYNVWDVDTPFLYDIKLTLFENNEAVSEYATKMGLRDIKYNTKQGFSINKKNIKLNGFNLHHDWGNLGAAFIEDAWRRRLLQLKKIGVNAVRCAHNPQAEKFYALCDEIGLLVYAEFYDKWFWKGSYSEEYFDDSWKNDIKTIIERDRNHPSIFLWSVGNEVELQGADTMIAQLKKMTQYTKNLDDTRPVSVALMPHCNPIPFGQDDDVNLLEKGLDAICGVTKEIAKHVDILSLNYQEQWYRMYHENFADVCIIGAEIYPYYTAQENSKFFNNRVNIHPYRYINELPYVLGGFVWSGVDYLGESYRYPARGFGCGLIDCAGFEKPFCAHYKALFTKQDFVDIMLLDDKQSYELVSPAWSYPKGVEHMNIEREDGEVVRVLTFSNCETVELLVGERSYGERQNSLNNDNKLSWNVLWHPKAITVIGRNNGKEVCTKTTPYFDKTNAYKIASDKTQLKADSKSVCFIEVYSVDEQNNHVKNDKSLIEITHSDNLEILAVDNGDNTKFYGAKPKIIPLFKGRCLICVTGTKTGKAYMEISCKENNISNTFKIDVI